MARLPSPVKVPIHLIRQNVSETRGIYSSINATSTYIAFHKYLSYRPQRCWGKVIFSEACVKNSVHRGRVCLSAYWDSRPPGTVTPPWEQINPAKCMLGDTATSERYASYWNAILFFHNSRPISQIIFLIS